MVYFIGYKTAKAPIQTGILIIDEVDLYKPITLIVNKWKGISARTFLSKLP